jgi:hypothetical protein
MTVTKLMLASFFLVLLTGCKAIVKDYSAAELESLKISLQGSDETTGSMQIYGEVYWTCYAKKGTLFVDVDGKNANTKLEMVGRIFRKQAPVSVHGVIVASHGLGENQINIKIDLKRQAAKFNISNNSNVHSGCPSEWFDLKQV